MVARAIVFGFVVGGDHAVAQVVGVFAGKINHGALIYRVSAEHGVAPVAGGDGWAMSNATAVLPSPVLAVRVDKPAL